MSWLAVVLVAVDLGRDCPKWQETPRRHLSYEPALGNLFGIVEAPTSYQNLQFNFYIGFYDASACWLSHMKQ